MSEVNDESLARLLALNGVAAAAWTIDGCTATAEQGVDWLGQPIRADSLFAAYCTTKPMLACGIIALVQFGLLHLDETVGSVLDEPMTHDLAHTPVLALLSHSSGLKFAGAIGIRALPDHLRWPYICSSVMAGAEPVAYGEAEPWFVLAKVIERRSGYSFDEFVHRAVLARYGIGPDDVVVHDPSDDALARVALSGVLLHGSEYASLAEVVRPNASTWNPAFGGYATCIGLHKFAQGLLADLDRATGRLDQRLVRDAVRPHASTGADPTLGHAATFGLGFMINGSSRGWIPELSSAAFGHASQGGRSFFVCDPDPAAPIAVISAFWLDSVNDLGLLVERRSRFVRDLMS